MAQQPRDVREAKRETTAGARGKEPKVIKRTNDVATVNIRSLAQKTQRERV